MISLLPPGDTLAAETAPDQPAKMMRNPALVLMALSRGGREGSWDRGEIGAEQDQDLEPEKD